MNHVDLTDDELKRFLGRQESQSVIPFSQIPLDDVIELFQHGDQQWGKELPWSKTSEAFRFRPNEMTIWAGESESGKTMILSQVMANSVYNHDQKWLVASLEMVLTNLKHRFLRQACGSAFPKEVHIRKANHLTMDKIWVYDSMKRCPPEVMLGLCIYAAEELKVQHIVLDSLVKIRLRIDDRDEITDFMDQLQKIVKAYEVHIHVVHHMRKPGTKEVKTTGKHRVKGFGEITDLADNVLLVERNEAKEIEQGKENPDPEILDKADSFLVVGKQRNFPWKGNIGLWFDKRSYQFLPCERCQPVEYVK